MTRNEFIKRIEEVGFIEHPEASTRGIYLHSNRIHLLALISNKDLFTSDDMCYSFDELEQYLANEGIVEKPFDVTSFYTIRENSLNGQNPSEEEWEQLEKLLLERE